MTRASPIGMSQQKVALPVIVSRYRSVESADSMIIKSRPTFEIWLARGVAVSCGSSDISTEAVLAEADSAFALFCFSSR